MTRPLGALMLAGVMRIEMAASRFRRRGFPLFHRWLAATFGMNMKAMLAGRQGFQIRRKFQPFVGFADFNATNRLTYPLRGNKVHLHFFTGGLRPGTHQQRQHSQTKTRHRTSFG